MPISRRSLVRAGALSIVGTSFPQTASTQSSGRQGIRSEFLADFDFRLGAVQDVGSRIIVPLTGGTCDGPRLKGTVLPGGADWLFRRPNGVLELDARFTLRTDDDQLIYVRAGGVRYTPEGGELYSRIVPVFDTESERYTWLNRIVAVGLGRNTPDGVAFETYEIL